MEPGNPLFGLDPGTYHFEQTGSQIDGVPCTAKFSVGTCGSQKTPSASSLRSAWDPRWQRRAVRPMVRRQRLQSGPDQRLVNEALADLHRCRHSWEDGICLVLAVRWVRWAPGSGNLALALAQ